MDAPSRSMPPLRWLVPLVAVVGLCAGCSTSKPPDTHGTGGLGVPVTVPANCAAKAASVPAAHVFVGLKATANNGLTEKQVSAAIPIPNDTTMPCASGADYTAGPPVAVQIFFLHGATAADQSQSAATLRATGQFSSVAVVPQP